MPKKNHIIIIILFIFIFCVGVILMLWLNNKYTPITVRDIVAEEPIIHGSTYYVSAEGNDQFDGLSKEGAFASIQKALNVMQPGDGVKILDGAYFQDAMTVRNGTKDKPIVMIGEKSAVVHGTGQRSRIFEINHDFIMLYGFTIDGLAGNRNDRKDYRDKLIYIEGKEAREGVQGVRIAKMQLLNAGGECVRVKYFSHNNEIFDNMIIGCGAYDFLFDGGGKNGEGIYIGTAPEQVEDDKNVTRDIDQSHRNWIHGNFIDTQGNECVDIKEGSSFNLVENNVCTGQKDKDSAGLDSRGNNNIFRNNDVSGSEGAGIRLGGDEDHDGIHNDVIGNYIHNNKSGGIKVQAKPQGKICQNKFSGNAKDDFVGEYGEDVENTKSCE